MKRLGILDKNRKLEFLKDLTSAENSLITTHTSILIEFDKQTEKFRLFKNAINDFRGLLNTNDSTNKYNRLILEVMSTFRAFLDHWETEIKRKFGKKSQEVELFKKATSHEFDNYFSYRFFSGFRNYVQHVRVPIFRINTFINDKNLIETKISVNKKELLESFDGWNAIVIEDFKNQPDLINVIPLIDELFESVKRINQTAINLLDIKGLLNSSNFLLSLRKLQGSFKGDLALVEFENIPGSQIKLNFLPISTADYIVKNTKINKLIIPDKLSHRSDSK